MEEINSFYNHIVAKYNLTAAMNRTNDIMGSKRWQTGLRNSGRRQFVKQHFARAFDPIFMQAMGVDASVMVDQLPGPMISWFARLAENNSNEQDPVI